MKAAILFVLLAGLIPDGESASAAGLEAGIATVEITPPIGYRMSGYFSERPSTGVHDPLMARALVLRQGESRAAIVICDLIGLPLELSTRVRWLAGSRTAIQPANIMIAATHTHTAPLYFGALRQHFHDRARAAHDGADPREEIDYADWLGKRLIEVIESAQKALKPIRLEAGTAIEEGLTFNRRFHMKEGGVRFNPGKLNPKIVRVAGPTDPEVGMLMLRDLEQGTPIAGLTVFALHLDTVGGTLYGGDYPHYLELSLKAKHGQSFFSFFGVGTCGDLNHIDVSHDRPQKGQEEARRIGERLAGTVLAALPELHAAIEKPDLAVRSTTVSVPLQECTPEEVATATANMALTGTRKLSFLDQVRAYKLKALERRLANGLTIPLEAQVFRLSSGVAIVGLPGEVFVDLGLAIKKASPFRTTLVIELANDAPGYIPTRRAFMEGSYETVNSRISSGGGEKLVAAAIALLEELGR